MQTADVAITMLLHL